MRFDVPQFIDVEDKIFGPLTFRQFIYLTGGGGLCYILYKVLPLYIAFLPIIIVAGLAFLLAFYKYNGKPFINLLESLFIYAIRDKLYLWKREKKKKETTPVLPKTEAVIRSGIPTMTGSKLHDISWGLDVLDSKRSENN